MKKVFLVEKKIVNGGEGGSRPIWKRFTFRIIYDGFPKVPDICPGIKSV